MVLFTRHALLKMQERNITEEEIRYILENPAKIVRQGDEWRAQRMRKNGRLLLIFYKMVYTNFGPAHLIITVFETSKLRKYL